MNRSIILKIFLLIPLFYFTCKAHEANNNTSNTSPKNSSSKFISSTEIALSSSKQAPVLKANSNKFPITTNVCNMSLIASVENENAVFKKCVCNDLQGDVECSYLRVTKLPKLISFPKNILIANFRGNKITSLTSENFYNGQNVIELDLSNNRIDFVSNSALKNFKKLLWLDLSHNRIWNVPKSIFEGLHNLRRLDLSYNKLMYLSHYHFSNLTELRDLNLKFNPLQDINARYFENLTKLENLNLESTMLKIIPDDIFLSNLNLRLLNLASNKLSEVPTRALTVLSKLKVLDLSANSVKVIHQEAFIGLKEIERLYLDRLPHLKRIENYAFGNIMHLQELHCSYNLMLSIIEVHAFVRKIDNREAVPSHLFLKQNNLKKISHSLLGSSFELELDLRDNPLHCDCHVAWMIHVPLKNNFQGHTRCFSPPELKNMALKDLKGKILRCDLPLPKNGTAWIICVVLLVTTALITIGTFLVWRHGKQNFSKTGFLRLSRKDSDTKITMEETVTL